MGLLYACFEYRTERKKKSQRMAVRGVVVVVVVVVVAILFRFDPSDGLKKLIIFLLACITLPSIIIASAELPWTYRLGDKNRSSKMFFI